MKNQLDEKPGHGGPAGPTGVGGTPSSGPSSTSNQAPGNKNQQSTGPGGGGGAFNSEWLTKLGSIGGIGGGGMFGGEEQQQGSPGMVPAESPAMDVPLVPREGMAQILKGLKQGLMDNALARARKTGVEPRDKRAVWKNLMDVV